MYSYQPQKFTVNSQYIFHCNFTVLYIYILLLWHIHEVFRCDLVINGFFNNYFTNNSQHFYYIFTTRISLVFTVFFSLKFHDSVFVCLSKLRKMPKKLSSAAVVIGALRVKSIKPSWLFSNSVVLFISEESIFPAYLTVRAVVAVLHRVGRPFSMVKGSNITINATHISH